MQTISYPTYVETCALTDYTLDSKCSHRQELPHNITQHTDFTAKQKHTYCIEWRREPVGLGLQLSYRHTFHLDVLFDEYSGYTQHCSGDSILQYVSTINAYLDTQQDVKRLQTLQAQVCYANVQKDFTLQVTILLK